MEEKFEEYLKFLKISYQNRPKDTMVELEKSLLNLKMIYPNEIKYSNSSEKKSIINDEKINTLITAILIVLIVLVGFLDISRFIIYIFGVTFFIVGFFISTTSERIGLVFLFSHGMTGLIIMFVSLLVDTFSSPIWQDNPSKFYIYFGIGICILIVAILMTILYNLSDELKQKKIILNIILFLYFIVILMAGIFPHIMNNINQFYIFK